MRRKLQLVTRNPCETWILLDMVLGVCKISPAFGSQLSTDFCKLGADSSHGVGPGLLPTIDTGEDSSGLTAAGGSANATDSDPGFQVSLI
jgi:hypothetical protein